MKLPEAVKATLFFGVIKRINDLHFKISHPNRYWEDYDEETLREIEEVIFWAENSGYNVQVIKKAYEKLLKKRRSQ